MFNLSNYVKKFVSFATCNFIQSRYTLDNLVEATFLSVGVIDPIERVLIHEDFEWAMSLDEEEILMLF